MMMTAKLSELVAELMLKRTTEKWGVKYGSTTASGQHFSTYLQPKMQPRHSAMQDLSHLAVTFFHFFAKLLVSNPIAIIVKP